MVSTATVISTGMWKKKSKFDANTFLLELNWEINSTDSIFLASNFQIFIVVYLHINSNISSDVKYLWLLLFIVQLELLFELCLSGGFTITCMGDFLLIYFGHKSSKASIWPKSFNYSISYLTTNPTYPPWLITKSSRFIHSTLCGMRRGDISVWDRNITVAQSLTSLQFQFELSV